MDLAVIEARWWKEGNSSVRGLFELLADIHEDNPATFHYEMFNNRASLEEVVKRVARRYRNIYIGAHGNRDSICGAEGRGRNNITRAVFRNVIRTATRPRRAKMRGLFVGSCQFVNEANGRFLLEENEGRGVNLRWVAGYAKSVEFVDSSLVDLFFWNTYFSVEEENERKRIISVAQRINEFMPGAHERLHFNIFLRKRTGVTSLLPIGR